MPLDVLKVGGIIFRTPHGFRCLESILSKTKKPAVIVISAIDKTSRNLNICLHLAVKGSLNNALETLDSIIEQHLSLACEILTKSNLTDYKQFLFSKKEALADILKGISLIADCSDRIADKIIAEGENLALELIYLFLSQKSLSINKLLSEHHILTNNKHQFASPNKEISINNLQNSLKKFSTDIFLIQGFTGISIDGKITTMGFESSNLTACLVAAAAKSERLVIWTDVAGIYSVDPKICDSPRHELISTENARVLSSEGLKIIYEPMLDYSEEFGFDIEIKDAFNPELSGTIISTVQKSSPLPFVIFDEKNISQAIYKISICFISSLKSIDLLNRLICNNIAPIRYEFDKDSLYLYFDRKFYWNNTIKEISKILF